MWYCVWLQGIIVDVPGRVSCLEYPIIVVIYWMVEMGSVRVWWQWVTSVSSCSGHSRCKKTKDHVQVAVRHCAHR